MKKRILVTGSSGMLGIDIAMHLRDKYELICTDIVESADPKCRTKDFIKCDITDEKQTIEAMHKAKPDIVIHTAAWTDVDGCELDGNKAMRVNADGTQNIALGCKENKAIMFFISSDFVFDGLKDESYVEDDKPNPVNIYGQSKLEGEEAVRKILERYFIVRTSWLFGKNGRNFVDIILDKADREKQLKIVMDQFGSPTYTKDLTLAIEKLIELSLANDKLSGVFHFSNSGSCSWYRYAEEIVRISGKVKTKLLPMTSLELDRPAKRPVMSILNTDKYAELCGEKPRNWQSALQDYLIKEQGIVKNYARNFKK